MHKDKKVEFDDEMKEKILWELYSFLNLEGVGEFTAQR